MKKFNKWLNTFIEEKGLDLDKTYEVEHGNNVHFIELETLVEYIKSASDNEKLTIRKTLVKIDILNGDCHHFFNHLATGYIQTNY